MTWLADTNIISEMRKRSRCHPGVVGWWAGVEERDLFLSVLTLGEIRRGIEGVRHRDPAKAAALERWVSDVADAFGPRVIGIDLAVTEALGGMSAARSVPVIDAQLAASAKVHDLVLVTRNTADASRLGVQTLNPFDATQA